MVVFQSFLVFNLGYDFNVLSAILGEQLTQITDVFRLANKGSRNEFDLFLDTKVDDIIDILFGKGRL